MSLVAQSERAVQQHVGHDDVIVTRVWRAKLAERDLRKRQATYLCPLLLAVSGENKAQIADCR